MSWDGFTPVHAAAAYGHAAVLHMLLTFGGDPKRATPSGVRVPPSCVRLAPPLPLPLGVPVIPPGSGHGTACVLVLAVLLAQCCGRPIHRMLTPSPDMGFLPALGHQVWKGSLQHAFGACLCCGKKQSSTMEAYTVYVCAAAQVTPVHLAAEKGHFALVSILLEHGADASALDQHR